MGCTFLLQWRREDTWTSSRWSPMLRVKTSELKIDYSYFKSCLQWQHPHWIFDLLGPAFSFKIPSILSLDSKGRNLGWLFLSRPNDNDRETQLEMRHVQAWHRSDLVATLTLQVVRKSRPLIQSTNHIICNTIDQISSFWRNRFIDTNN